MTQRLSVLLGTLCLATVVTAALAQSGAGEGRSKIERELGAIHALDVSAVRPLSRGSRQDLVAAAADKASPRSARLRAIGRLALGPESVQRAEVWAQAASDDDVEIRIQVAFSEGLLRSRAGESACLSWARQTLADTEPRVRETAVDLLARKGTPAARELLREQRRLETDEAVRRRIDRRLAKF